MIKSLRQQFWYISAYLKKYLVTILFSIFGSVAILLVLNFAISKLPAAKPHKKIAIIGQYSISQLPQPVLQVINGGLTKSNENMETIPNLAEKWGFDEPTNTYSFFLKPNLTWSDGEAVNVKDIKISIPGVSIETIEPNIIKFKLPSKFSPFPSLLNFPIISSKGKLIGEWKVQIKQKSSGVITQIVLDSSSRRITFNFYQTPKQAITAFKLGQADLVLNIPTGQATENLNQYGFTKSSTNKNQVVLLIFNNSDPNLKEKSVRQGISYLFTDKAFGFEPAISTLNPNSWGFNPLVKTYTHNLARAKELIKTPISLELSTTPELLPTAEKLKSQLDPNLINLNIKVITSTPDQFQLYLTNFQIPADPDQYQYWHSTQNTNIGKVNDEKIDKYLEDGRTTYDQKSRKIIYYDFQKVFSEEVPAIPLYHPSYTNLSRNQSDFDIMTIQ